MVYILETPIQFGKPIDSFYHTSNPPEIPNTRVVEEFSINSFYQGKPWYIVTTPTNRIKIIVTLYGSGYMSVILSQFPFNGTLGMPIRALDEIDLKKLDHSYGKMLPLEKTITTYFGLIEKIEKIFAPHAEVLPTSYFLDNMRKEKITLF